MTPSHARLRRARLEAGFDTMAAAAEANGWDPYIYRSHETGRRKFDEEWANTYGRAFRVKPEWLLYGRGRPAFARVPVMGVVGAGAQILPMDVRVESIDPPPDCPDDAFALIVRGDSMEAAFSDGDMLVCVNEPAIDRLIGKRAIVDLSTGERYVKRIIRGSSPGTYTLVSLNGSVIADVRIERAARIIWVRPA